MYGNGVAHRARCYHPDIVWLSLANLHSACPTRPFSCYCGIRAPLLCRCNGCVNVSFDLFNTAKEESEAFVGEQRWLRTSFSGPVGWFFCENGQPTIICPFSLVVDIFLAFWDLGYSGFRLAAVELSTTECSSGRAPKGFGRGGGGGDLDKQKHPGLQGLFGQAFFKEEATDKLNLANSISQLW